MIQGFLLVSLITLVGALPVDVTSSNEIPDVQNFGYFSVNNNSYIFQGSDMSCTIVDGILYINGEKKGPLTAEQQQQLQQYTTEAEQWSANLGKSIMEALWSGLTGIFGNPTSSTAQPTTTAMPFPPVPAFCNQS
ncbi:hypothetical protein Tcan_11584 [Toxocara canis]|uniref:Pepsin inhibitor-3-like repeated domain-containing protein n=2 Tax=Toxocara canis TaxID=6265 RepID=A0A0B2VYK8_TOXCA|nr:hypothetical protein Tcan_11584 [Toxocara canis]VDM47969.1 unnamed protein product [Toxocara canis]